MSGLRDMSRRQDNYKAKGVFKQDELRRRREEAQVEIRRQKREESMAKRRNLNVEDDTDGAIQMTMTLPPLLSMLNSPMNSQG